MEHEHLIRLKVLGDLIELVNLHCALTVHYYENLCNEKWEQESGISKPW